MNKLLDKYFFEKNAIKITFLLAYPNKCKIFYLLFCNTLKRIYP